MLTATKIQMIKHSIMSLNINACLDELNISWSVIFRHGDLSELNAADDAFFKELGGQLKSLSLSSDELRNLNIIIHEYLSEHPIRKKLIEGVIRQESMKPIKIDFSQTSIAPYLPVDDSIARKIDFL